MTTSTVLAAFSRSLSRWISAWESALWAHKHNPDHHRNPPRRSLLRSGAEESAENDRLDDGDDLTDQQTHCGDRGAALEHTAQTAARSGGVRFDSRHRTS